MYTAERGACVCVYVHTERCCVYTAERGACVRVYVHTERCCVYTAERGACCVRVYVPYGAMLCVPC